MKKLLFYLIFISFSLQATDRSEQIKDKRIIQYFFNTGNVLLDDLQQISPDFYINNHPIEIEKLKDALNNGNIDLATKELVDNSGSLVDSIGVFQQVILYKKSWLEFIKSDVDIRLLVLHEILRMAAINDDNYMISKKLYGELNPLQTMEDISIRPYCNLRAKKTITVIQTKKVKGKGSDSIKNTGMILIISGNGSNSNSAWQAAIKDASQKCLDAGYDEFQYHRGTRFIGSSNNNGFKKSGIEVNVRGVCIRNKIKKRPKKEIKAEICGKINQCYEIYSSAPGNIITQDDFDELDKLKRKNKCGQKEFSFFSFWKWF
ncbi:MAG: hypothetical protein KAQ98_09475 [Bacteriovoracaceae bacterium]|nr:hypothetical protein [Bacteriovoracaceae bacterium]